MSRRDEISVDVSKRKGGRRDEQVDPVPVAEPRRGQLGHNDQVRVPDLARDVQVGDGRIAEVEPQRLLAELPAREVPRGWQDCVVAEGRVEARLEGRGLL